MELTLSVPQLPVSLLESGDYTNLSSHKDVAECNYICEVLSYYRDGHQRKKKNVRKLIQDSLNAEKKSRQKSVAEQKRGKEILNSCSLSRCSTFCELKLARKPTEAEHMIVQLRTAPQCMRKLETGCVHLQDFWVPAFVTWIFFSNRNLLYTIKEMIDALNLNNEEHSPHHHLMKLLALTGISNRGGRKAFTFLSPW